MSNEIETLDVPNIGVRVFRRPKCRILSAKTGEVVPPEKLARALVAVAALEHAVVRDLRPTVLTCGCGALVPVKPAGRFPTACAECREDTKRERAAEYARQSRKKPRTEEQKRRSVERALAWRDANPEQHKANRRERYFVDNERRREQARKDSAQARAKNPEVVRDRMRKCREKKIAAGFCTICLTRKSREGMHTCGECRASRKAKPA